MKRIRPHLDETPEEAVTSTEKLVAVQIRLFGEDGGPTSRARADLARALESAGRPIEARVLWEQVVLAHRRNRGPEDEQTLDAELWLVSSLARQGMYEDALPLAVHVRDGRRHIKGIKSNDIAKADQWVTTLTKALGAREE
jgi:hypothetical protein